MGEWVVACRYRNAYTCFEHSMVDGLRDKIEERFLHFESHNFAGAKLKGKAPALSGRNDSFLLRRWLVGGDRKR
jgi:hypothetical protein